MTVRSPLSNAFIMIIYKEILQNSCLVDLTINTTWQRVFPLFLYVRYLEIPWWIKALACCPENLHSRPRRTRSFWSAPKIATPRTVQNQKSAIHGLPITLRMLRVKSGKSDWLVVRNEISAHAQTSDPARCRPKATRSLWMRKENPMFNQYSHVWPFAQIFYPQTIWRVS